MAITSTYLKDKCVEKNNFSESPHVLEFTKAISTSNWICPNTNFLFLMKIMIP